MVWGHSQGGHAALWTGIDAPLFAWTTARFADEPQASGCARRSF